jgi:hypothetical protein
MMDRYSSKWRIETSHTAQNLFSYRNDADIMQVISTRE